MSEKRFRRTKDEIKQGLTIEQAKAYRLLQQKSEITDFSNAEPNNQLFTLDRWRIEKIELSKEEERRLMFKKAETRRKVDEMLNPLTRQKPSESNGSFFKDPLVP